MYIANKDKRKCVERRQKVAYRNLKVEMGRCDVTIEAISKVLGIHRNSVANKLNGTSSFSIEEAMEIHNVFFPNLGYKYLFATEEDPVDGKV